MMEEHDYGILQQHNNLQYLMLSMSYYQASALFFSYNLQGKFIIWLLIMNAIHEFVLTVFIL